MRKQFVLDKRTDKMLQELASYVGGNRSLVVREAIKLYSNMEDRLERIEADPAFQKMMEQSDRAIREGRVTPHEEVVRKSKALAKRSGSFPSVVVRDFAGDVMKDVGLRDTVGSMSTNPSHDRATITEEVAVQSSQCTTRESELRSTVVREEGVGMLKECDEDKPVVDPEVRHQVETEHSPEPKCIDRAGQTSEPEDDSYIRQNDRVALVRSEHHSIRVEI